MFIPMHVLHRIIACKLQCKFESDDEKKTILHFVGWMQLSCQLTNKKNIGYIYIFLFLVLYLLYILVLIIYLSVAYELIWRSRSEVKKVA